MAKKEKNNKKWLKVTLITLLVLLILGVGRFVVYKQFFDKGQSKDKVEIKELDNLKEYGYVLTDKDTQYFKTEFEILKELLKKDEIDEENYATQVAKLFVIDLYTMSNKVNKYDVGGTDYYHSDKTTMFQQKVMDELYGNVKDNTYGDREQVLPEVNEVIVNSIEKIDYKLYEEVNSCYLVKVDIKYVTDLKYDNKGSIVVCKDGEKRLSVVDFQPTSEPKYENEKNNK